MAQGDYFYDANTAMQACCQNVTASDTRARLDHAPPVHANGALLD
jgi:hypothetical protein